MSTHSVMPSVHPGLLANQILESCPPTVTATQITSAIRGTSPIVGIPMEGREPLRLDRKRLAGAMKGVTPVEITVIDHGEGEYRRTSLQVKGVAGPRVRTRFRIISFARPAVRRELHEWANREAVRIRKPKAATEKGLKEIAKLERELTKIGTVSRIPNPAVPTLHPRQMNDHSRAEIMQWKAEKRSRTILGSVAKKYRSDASTKLYAHLRSLGFTVTTYSEIPQRTKERQGIASIFDYQSKLWMFCGLLTMKPYDLQNSFYSWNVPVWGVDRYTPYLNKINQRESLQAQIDSIRALTQPQDVLTA